MIKSLGLILPALIPSWRFFSTITPSVRIEYVITQLDALTNADWQEFRPRATQLTSSAVIKRLLWNPHWNETLFLVTCAERLISAPSQHSIDEINTRLLRQLTATPRPPAPSQYLYFRLAFWERQGIELTKTIEYVSEGTPIGGAVNDL